MTSNLFLVLGLVGLPVGAHDGELAEEIGLMRSGRRTRNKRGLVISLVDIESSTVIGINRLEEYQGMMYLGWGKALGDEEDTSTGGDTETGSATSPMRCDRCIDRAGKERVRGDVRSSSRYVPMCRICTCLNVTS